ncbi:MAG TPA: hypothetical protein GXX49_06285 [Clostridiaceae bacterium]|nr:hypothetical protein [Clostridiaceae bacterium]
MLHKGRAGGNRGDWKNCPHGSTWEPQEAIGGTGRIVPMVPHRNRRRQSAGDRKNCPYGSTWERQEAINRGTGRTVPMVPNGNRRRRQSAGTIPMVPHL